MWNFLIALLPFLKDIKWKNVISELQKIPKWLQKLLTFSVIIGFLYFGYTKIFQVNTLLSLRSEVIDLNTKVEEVITVSEYNVDIEYIISTIYLMEELTDHTNTAIMVNQDILLSYLKSEHPNDPNIQLIENSKERIEYQRRILKDNLHNIIRKIDPLYVDSLRNSK